MIQASSNVEDWLIVHFEGIRPYVFISLFPFGERVEMEDVIIQCLEKTK